MVRLSSQFPVLLCAAVFLFHITACTKRIPIADYDQVREERFLHIKLQNGDQLKVKDPKIEGDFLLGKTPLYDTRPGPYKDVKIALAQIDNIQVERFSLSKTIITLGVLTVAFGTFFYFISQFENGFN